MNGVPHGQGRVTYPDGSTQTGSMYNRWWEGEVVDIGRDKMRMREGQCVERFQYKNGSLDGYWEGTSPDGIIDRGCYKDRLHGPRMLTFPNGIVKFMEWNDGKCNGFYMNINADRNEVEFGRQVEWKKHGERRIFTLAKIEMWINGKCTDKKP